MNISFLLCLEASKLVSPMVIVPDFAKASAFSVRKSVVLPEPLGPIIAVTVPLSYEKLTSFSIVFSLYLCIR